MTLKTFFEKFDQFADAHEAVPQIRRVILTLAVQGKLVSQDPNEAPVAELLAKSDAKRAEIALSDRRAKKEDQPLLSADDRWPIPSEWAWRGLADLVLFVDYRGKTPTKISSGVRLLTAKNVRKGLINLSPEEFLSESDYDAWMTRGIPKSGDILFTTEAPMGNAAVIELTERFALAQRVICFQDYGALNSSFLVLQFLSDQFQNILNINGTGMTAKGIKAAKLKQLPIAIPPLAEQKRIVAKVDELMALCDRLEAQQQERDTRHAALARASLARFAEAPTPDNLEFLFHSSFHIQPSSLRKSILTLAVQGKLVPQDPNDEPGGALLKTIEGNRAELVRQKKAKPELKLHRSAKADPPPWKPSGWEWRRFNDVIWCFRGHNPPKSEFITQPREGYIRFVQITDFKTDSRAVYVPISPKNKLVAKDEIIMAAYRHIGKLSRRMEGAFNVALCKVMEVPPMSRDFIELLIGTDLVKGELLEASGRAHIPSMHSDHLLSLWVPIPPLAEQRRIVAKVDQLMALVDELETQLAASRATAKNLLQALVAELTTTP